MRPIDADRLLSERMKSMYYHLPNGDIAIPIIDIKNAPTIPEQRWIPCSEGTPKKTGYYICTCHDGACYRTSVLKWVTGWVLTGARSYWKVIAWMSLPEPYQEGK